MCKGPVGIGLCGQRLCGQTSRICILTIIIKPVNSEVDLIYSKIDFLQVSFRWGQAAGNSIELSMILMRYSWLLNHETVYYA